jgi:hypothetical protein
MKAVTSMRVWKATIPFVIFSEYVYLSSSFLLINVILYKKEQTKLALTGVKNVIGPCERDPIMSIASVLKDRLINIENCVESRRTRDFYATQN